MSNGLTTSVARFALKFATESWRHLPAADQRAGVLSSLITAIALAVEKDAEPVLALTIAITALERMRANVEAGLPLFKLPDGEAS